MKCRNCGTENPDHAKFCNECGAKLRPAISLKKDDPPPAFMDRTYIRDNNRPVSVPNPVPEPSAPPMEPEPAPPPTNAPVFFSSSTPNRDDADLPRSAFSEPPVTGRSAAVPEVFPNLRLSWGEEEDDEDEPEEPWYESTWGCIAALLLFFPLGVFLLWKFHKKWGALCNAAITAGFAVVSLPLTVILLNLILTVHPTDLKILNDDYFLNINDTAYVDLRIEPKDASSSRIYFGSSDEQVAIFEGFIDDGKLRGKLTAMGGGTSTISLCADGVQSNTVSVTVIDPAEDEREAENFSLRIRLIEEVTLDKAAKIKGLVQEYNDFPDRIKKLIPNADVLMEANRTLEQLQKEEQERIGRTIQEIIASIDQIGEVTLEKQDLVSSIREQCKSLPKSELQNISNYRTLINAEWTIKELLLRQDFISHCEPVTPALYKRYLRNPDTYQEQSTHFRGTIFQVVEETKKRTSYLARLTDETGDTDMVICFSYQLGDQPRILEEDLVSVYGTYNGTMRYFTSETTTATVPRVTAEIVDVESD